ncbi:MAG: COX15/CtaA family protein, partial [Acidobacteriota bacterium]
ATFGLLLLGALVHPTGSSLVCPDWPLCFGQAFPAMKGNIAIEHGHRMAGATIGLLTIALVIAGWRRQRGLVLLALVLVITQGLLGGITVLYRLPPMVSTAHLAMGMTFFLVLLTTCARLGGAGGESTAPGRGLATWLFGAVFFQMVLGGLVRHLGAGFACGNNPFTCHGDLWPVQPPEQLQMFHRACGALILLAVLAATPRLIRGAKSAGRPLARMAVLAAPILVVVQVALGMLTVMTNVAVAPVVAHTGGAALLLGSLWLARLSLSEAPTSRATTETSVPSFTEQPA